MGVIAWQNAPMRWPWSGIQEELRLLHEQHERHKVDYDRLIEEHRRFITECILDMRRHAEERERKVNRQLEELHEETREILAEQRAGRQALLHVLDRLGPAPGTA
jgi:hypothetical protein